MSNHPVLAGVNSLNGGPNTIRGGAWSTSATKVAQWSDGNPLVGVIQVGGTNRVDLSMFPPSSTVSIYGWLATTDGARLMANAISYTIRSTSCTALTDCKSCASGGCQWCLDSSTCQTIGTDCPDTVENPADCPFDCSSFAKCNTCVDESNQGVCTWCLNLKQCVTHADSKNCHGVINNKKFCPSPFTFTD